MAVKSKGISTEHNGLQAALMALIFFFLAGWLSYHPI